MLNWRDARSKPVSSEEDLVRFLEAVGICLWTPARNLDFPNLSEMMDIPPGDVLGRTWFWKDDLHEQKRLFYGKLLAGNATFVSMRFLPYVIAARGDIDPHTLHEHGRLPDSAIRIYDALMGARRLATHDLRRESGLAGRADHAEFESAVNALCALFQVCKVGITGRTRSTYGYVWGLVEDWIPDVLTQAARLRPDDAARVVAARLAGLAVRLSPRQWKRLFGWHDETIEVVLTGA